MSEPAPSAGQLPEAWQPDPGTPPVSRGGAPESFVYWADKPTVDLSEVLAEGIENGRSSRFPPGLLKLIGLLALVIFLGVGILAVAGAFGSMP